MQNKKITHAKNSIFLFSYLLIVWGFYRFLFELPEPVTELFVKPVLWLVPLFIILRRERASFKDLGFTTENLFTAVYFALSLGAFFAVEGLIVNILKHGGLNFGSAIGENTFIVALLLSTVTAVVEEVTFRGYLFGRAWKILGNEWIANLLIGIGWTFVHMPVAIFVWQLGAGELFGFSLITLSFGVGAGFVYAKTKNILSPILLHVLWQWPIILFR